MGQFVWGICGVESDNSSMRSFYHMLGDALAHQPNDFVDLLTPWILLAFGGIILLLMTYAWWTCPAY